jgi:hypothetical protein
VIKWKEGSRFLRVADKSDSHDEEEQFAVVSNSSRWPGIHAAKTPVELKAAFDAAIGEIDFDPSDAMALYGECKRHLENLGVAEDRRKVILDRLSIALTNLGVNMEPDEDELPF